MFRTLITCVTICVLALTSVAAGVARGQADPVGQMVICSGTGPVMVHMDATGKPTGPPVLCPDGVMALLAAVADPAPDVARSVTVADLAPTATHRPLAQDARIEGRARSPPPRA